MQVLAKAQASKFNNWRCNNGFLFPADTIYQMIVYHTGGLHVGIANGGAKKLDASFFEVFGNFIGKFGAGGYFF